MIKIIKKIKNSLEFQRIWFFIKKIIFFIWPEQIIKQNFKRRTGYELNLDNPKTYNEKLQWMKLYWDDPRLTICADKYEVRNFIKERGCEEILTDIIGIYNNSDDIDFDKLPNKFAIKATHGSGWNIICEDKEKLNWNKEKKKINKWLKMNYFYHSFELAYKNIKPRIICEKFIETKDGKLPKDYKIFCFNGEPKIIFVASDRGEGTTKNDFYTCDWKHIDVRQYYPNSEEVLPRPSQLDDMLNIAKKLSKGFPQVRIDLYSEEDRIMFSEMTFYHFSGNQPFKPHKYDEILGEYFELTN